MPQGIRPQNVALILLAVAVSSCTFSSTPTAATAGAVAPGTVEGLCYSDSNLRVPCDSVLAKTMVNALGSYERVESGWKPRPAVAEEPDSEAVTPIVNSDLVSIPTAPLNPDCAGEVCDGFTGCRQVSMNTLAGVFPQILPDEKPVSEQSNYIVGPPSPLDIVLVPARVGPHEAATRTVHCDCYNRHLECRFRSERAVFDADPHDAVVLSDTMTVAEGLAILRLWRGGKTEFADTEYGETYGESHLAGIYRNSGHYELDLDSCGPDMLADLKSRFGRKRLRFLREIHGSGCA